MNVTMMMVVMTIVSLSFLFFSFMGLTHPGGLDLVITPGVAFTESGQRLGSGRGYYDRYLKKLMTTSSSTSSPSSFIRIIGLAFRQQVLPSLPTDEYDVSVHQVIHA